MRIIKLHLCETNKKLLLNIDYLAKETETLDLKMRTIASKIILLQTKKKNLEKKEIIINK